MTLVLNMAQSVKIDLYIEFEKIVLWEITLYFTSQVKRVFRLRILEIQSGICYINFSKRFV